MPEQKIPQKPARKKLLKKSEFAYFYTVDPSNFHSLPKDKQEQKVGEFLDLLRTLEKTIRITFTRKAVPLLIDGKNETKHVLQVLLAAKEPLTGILDSRMYEYTVDDAHKRIRFDSEKLSYLKYSGGFVRCLTLYDMPSQLRWAWVHEVFSECNQIDVWVDPLEKEHSLNILRKKRAMLMKRAETNKQAAAEYGDAESVEDMLNQGLGKMYRVGMVAMLHGNTLKELNTNTKEFKRHLRVTGGMFDPTMSRQGSMYYGTWIKYLTVDQSFMSILYPFVSAEMIEMPNGVLLGYNMDSNGPVIYDIMGRMNGNVIIIGSPGSGKSFTAKLFVKRLIQRVLDEDETDEGPAVFIVDPMNEYYKHKEYYGLGGMLITGDEELGIDPFKILKPTDAASVLASVTKADEKDTGVANEFFRYADKVDSVHELHEKVSDKAKEYLQHLVDGPLSKIMKGETRLTDRTVISLNGADGKPHEVLILLLVLNKIWNEVINMPTNRPKIIVVDEGWLLTKMKGAMNHIDQIARMGRKLNVKFVFISQRVDDVADDKGPEGKMVDIVGTKILMQLEDDAADSAQTILKLTEEEKERIKRFAPGQGMMITEKHRIKVKFEATEDETKTYFNSRPDA